MIVTLPSSMRDPSLFTRQTQRGSSQRGSSCFQPAMLSQGLIAGVLEAGQDIPKEYFEAILRKACPLTNTMMEPDEIAQVWPRSVV